MFYRPGIDQHGLPHNPFKAMVVPRPIGWISSCDSEGRVNLAPYSFFNALSDDPPMVMFTSNGTKPDRGFSKDSASNIRETGEFVCNLVGYDMRDEMNRTSGKWRADEDEFAIAGLEKDPSQVVKPPRVRGVPGALECRMWKIVELPGPANFMVIGEVIGVYIDEAMLSDGIFDVTRWMPLTRLGYRDYAAIGEVFSLKRPGE